MIETLREENAPWSFELWSPWTFQRWTCDACGQTIVVITFSPEGWYHAKIAPDWERVYCPACVRKAAGRILGLIDDG